MKSLTARVPGGRTPFGGTRVEPVIEIGECWNESETCRDPLTGRRVRRLSSRGLINQTPTYHTNSGFTADGRYLVLVSIREGGTWVVRAEAATGELKALWRAPGIGDRSYIHRGMELDTPEVDGRGLCGNRLCIAPQSGLAIFTCDRRMLAVDLKTCAVRVLLEDAGEDRIFGAPTVSAEEDWVAITLSSAHPELLAGQARTKRYTDYPDHALRIVRAPLDGSGRLETLYERQPAQSAHCAYCPTDNDLLYFDLDLPPRYWEGSDGTTPRIWLLDTTTKEARPLKEKFPGPLQTHQAWLWDGSALAYHGPLPSGGVYIGVTRRDGETLWEREFPHARYYGHLTADALRPALILDGDFTPDRLQWLYYDGDPPRLEPICIHGTEWGSLPGQYSHPHPLTDPQGQWIAFNAARRGRSDVYVVQV